MNMQQKQRAVIHRLISDRSKEHGERVAQRRHVTQTLVKIMLDNGMTQREIADEVGVSQASISHSLTGRTGMSHGSITLLLDVMKRRRIKLPKGGKIWLPL